MKPSSVGLVLLSLFGVTAVSADPCEFKGLHIGAQMTPTEVMHTLGVSQFNLDPKRPEPFKEDSAYYEKNGVSYSTKYGVMNLLEMIDAKMGPYCESKGRGETSCRIPSGEWGRQHDWMKVYVKIDKGIVESMDVSFASMAVDDFMEIAKRKYGSAGWTTETDHMVIMNMEDKTHITVDRFVSTKTTAMCKTWITNYDIIELHHTGPAYQGFMEISLLDKDF